MISYNPAPTPINDYIGKQVGAWLVANIYFSIFWGEEKNVISEIAWK